MKQALVFIGTVLPPDELRQYPDASVAGNQYQYGLLRSVAGILHDGVDCLTVVPVAMWRGHGRLLCSARTFHPEPGLRIHALPLFNFLGIKQIGISLMLTGQLIKWAWGKRRNTGRTIVVYNTFSYSTLPAGIVAKLTRSQLVLLIADVPIPGTAKGRLQSMEQILQMALMRKAEKVVCLSRITGEELVGDAPFMVMEGGWWGSKTESTADSDPGWAPAGHNDGLIVNSYNVVFAGSLNSVSGIELAIEAVQRISQIPVRLVIFGSGPLTGYVERAAIANPDRIVYRGKVPHWQVIEAERLSDAVICPRLPDSFVTRFTFPSKIYEYMSVGVPVVTNALDGMPEDCLEHANIPDGPDAESWANCLVKVLKDSDGEARNRALAAKNFVQSVKNWDRQADRFVKFIEQEGADE